MHLRGDGIGLFDGVLQRSGDGGTADDAAAVREQHAVFFLGARDEDLLAHGLVNGKRQALFVAAGVALGGENHAAGVFLAKTHQLRLQLAAGDGLHDRQQIALQKRQHDLGLRVAEAAVVFDDLRAPGCEHQAEVEAAAEGAALGVHRAHGGQEDLLHAARGDRVRVIGVRRDGAHAAGVRADVAVAGALVVHRGHHRHETLAVGEAQHRDLGTLEILLDDDALAAFAKAALAHHFSDGLLCLLARLGDDDALADREAVGLDDGRHGGGIQIAQRFFGLVEDLEGRRRDAVFLHETLGKDLAALDLRGLGRGAEAGDARRLEQIDAAERERIVGRYHGVVDMLLYGKIADGLDIGGGDRNARRVPGDAAVAGQGVELGDLGIFP